MKSEARAIISGSVLVPTKKRRATNGDCFCSSVIKPKNSDGSRFEHRRVSVVWDASHSCRRQAGTGPRRGAHKMRRPWGPGAVEGGGVHMGMQARSRPQMVAVSVEAVAGAAGDQRGGRRATRPDVEMEMDAGGGCRRWAGSVWSCSEPSRVNAREQPGAPTRGSPRARPAALPSQQGGGG